MSPLDVASARAKVRALEAKANAKTSIGASLEQVASDLASVKGDRVVVLVTDGEETCGGEPAAAIARLTKGGATVRVNIVGFAIDDSALASTFEHWAQAGNRAYFEARDGAELPACNCERRKARWRDAGASLGRRRLPLKRLSQTRPCRAQRRFVYKPTIGATRLRRGSNARCAAPNAGLCTNRRSARRKPPFVPYHPRSSSHGHAERLLLAE